jgi:hypothetical protein
MPSFPRVILVLVVLTVCAGLVFAVKTCPSCGAANKDSNKFCKTCGAKLPDAPPPQSTTPRVSGSVSVSGPVVRITSQPTGAEVSVDGRSRGRTPLQLTDLGPGRHEVEIARSGYRSFYGEFTLSGSFGSIVVTTFPVGAEVLLDGKSRGNAPDGGLSLVGVPFGRHTITARLFGYNDAVQTVDLKSVGPLGVTCRLEYGRGWLLVKSDPPGAGLFINDTAAGQTPFAVELEPARYALKLLRRGFYDWTGDANVQYAESTTVRAVLFRIETRKLPLLLGAIAGLGGGAVSAAMGESEYAKYRDASTPADAEKYHRSTAAWDMRRNVALAAGVALAGAWWVLKW